MDVELYDLGSVHISRIGDIDADLRTGLRPDKVLFKDRLAIFESRIAQAESERVEITGMCPYELP